MAVTASSSSSSIGDDIANNSNNTLNANANNNKKRKWSATNSFRLTFFLTCALVDMQLLRSIGEAETRNLADFERSVEQAIHSNPFGGSSSNNDNNKSNRNGIIAEHKTEQQQKTNLTESTRSNETQRLVEENDEQKEQPQPQLAAAALQNQVDATPFSACLLWKDDNSRLSEWIAYHYWALPLRRLVIAVDPHSMTSPLERLARWGDRIAIEVWDETRFEQTPNQFNNIESCTNLTDPNQRCGLLPAHRKRQATFYQTCARHMHDHYNSTWTTFTDVDEYLTMSDDAFAENHTQVQALSRQPGHVSKLVEQFANPKPVRWENVSEHIYTDFAKRPCFVVPRIMFSALESTPEEIRHGVPSGFDPTSLSTMRYRYRSSDRFDGKQIREDLMGKSLMDVSRMTKAHWKSPTSTVHVVSMAACGGPVRQTHRRLMDSPVGIHHYFGSLAQYNCRIDPRPKAARKKTWKTQSQLDRGGSNDRIRPWLQGFVDLVGKDDAVRLLRGSGDVSDCPANNRKPDTKQAQ